MTNVGWARFFAPTGLAPQQVYGGRDETALTLLWLSLLIKNIRMQLAGDVSLPDSG